MSMLSGGVAWLGILPSVAGVIVCALSLDRSRWSALLLGGFAGEVVLAVFYRILPYLFGRGLSTQSAAVNATFVAAGLFSLLANTAIVAGVAGLLHDMRDAPERSRPVEESRTA